MCHAVCFADVAYGVHLVFHQSYERGDDYGQAIHHECRQLVAERFATSSRHQHKHILTFKQATDDGFLILLEAIKAEISFQRVFERCFPIHKLSG